MRVNSSSAHLSSIPNSLLSQIVEPWYESLRNPRETQERALQTLLLGYSKTDYGARYGASQSFAIMASAGMGSVDLVAVASG